ncbi:MAG TPA: calcium-binding protein [Frankiaceae bacterium]|nr:calcium-binding protein [Frankiaceae bacterium]
MTRRLVGRSSTVLLSTAVLLYGLPLLGAEALSPGTPEAIGTARGLATFAVAMDALADHPAFATKLPLTDRSPADVLGFPTLFTRTLAGPLSTFDGDYGDLDDAIEDASGSGVTYTVPGGIATAGDVATFTLHAVVRGEQDVPISYVRPGGSPDDPNPRPAVTVHGTDTAGTGTVPVGMTLTLDVPFRMDKAVVGDLGIDLPRAFSAIPNAATMTLATDGDSSETGLSFTSRYGFTDVTVTGRAAYAIQGATTFTDPDADGYVTAAEWATTLLPDWAAFALTDPAGTTPSVDVSLAFGSSLLPAGTSGGTVTYLDAGAPSYVDLRPVSTTASAPSAPVVSLANLEPFTRVGADDALTGLSQFAAAMAGAQARVDVNVPLLSRRFSEAYDPAGELQTLVEHQGSAAIVCGKADTQPPTGADLAGTTWYCQAVTGTPVSGGVSWMRSDGTTTGITNGTTASTVGPAPTTNVTVTGSEVEPDVAVQFDVTQEQPQGGTATVTFTATPRIRSAQELQAALDALPGSTITAAYDAAAEKLTYAVSLSDDPASMRASFDVGDALRQGTGLSGLALRAPADPDDETQTKPVTVDVGETTLAATYGLLLQDDLAALDSDALDGQVDRYFAVLGSGHEFEIDGVTASGAGAVFDGKVGYLAVEATATEWALAPTGTGPVVAADLATDSAHPIAGRDNVTVPGGVSLRRLLAMDTRPSATWGLRLDTSFDVDAAGTLAGLTSGTDQAVVTGDWADVSDTTKPVATPNAAYATYLRLFDVLPLVESGATNATASTTVLNDAGTDFLSAFGHTIAAGSKLGATLQNVTTGATCEDVTVTGAHTLTCDASSTVDDGTTAGRTLTGMSGGRRAATRTGTGTDGKPTYANADGTTVTTATYDDNTWRSGDGWRVSGDQDALRGLLLENLYDVANRLDQSSEPGYVAPLPMIGLTPKRLTPQLAGIRDVAAAIGERVPVTAQAPTWKRATAAAVDALVLPSNPSAASPLLFKATTAGTTGSAEPTWPATAGATVTDGTVTWTAVAPAATPPATLQELVAAIDGELDARTSANGVTLSGAEVGVTLDRFAHTLPNGTSLANKPHLQLSVAWDGAATLDAPFRMDLAPISNLDLHGLADDEGAVGSFAVSANSEAKVRFAVPLDPGIPSGDVVVRADSGITSLTATVDDANVDLTASVGSIALRLGTGARLFGRHTPVTGTHTADPVVTGTLSALTRSGTTGTGSTGSTLVDPQADFTALGVDTTATVTSGANSCTVSAVVNATTLTCALNNSATWANGSGYALSQNATAAVATASALTGQGFNAVRAGDVLKAGAVTCTVTATTGKAQTTLACPATGGSWTSGQAFTVERGAVLTDSAASFTSYTTSAGAAVVNTTKSASCATGTITATTIACATGTALSGGAVWQRTNAYRFDLGDPTKTLVHPDAGFDTKSLVGRTVRNTTDNASCVVTSATDDSLTCAVALTGGARWDAGDYYEVQGPGVAKANLSSFSLTGAVDDDPASYASETNLSVSRSGTSQSCNDSAVASTTSGDVCAVLAAQLVDPNAPKGTATSVAGNVVTVSSVPAAVVVGTEIRNETVSYSCVVTARTATTFTCPAPSGKAWAQGNAWAVDEGDYVGVLTYRATFSSGASVAGGLSNGFTDAVAADEPLEFSLITVAMNMLKTYVQEGLDGTLAAEPLPLIGLDRTAGSHVMDGLAALEDELAAVPAPVYTSMPQFKGALETYMANAIGNNSTLLRVLSPKTTANNDTGVTVTLLCKTTPNGAEHACATDGTETDENISDVRVRLTIGGDAATSARMSKGCTATTCSATTPSIHLDRFETGLPGLQLDGPNGVDVEAGWTYDVDFGLARDVGPYLGTTVTAPGGTADPALEVGASVHLPDTGTCSVTTHAAGVSAGGFSTSRCYQATLGLLQGIVYDGNGSVDSTTDGTDADRTGLRVKASLDLSGGVGTDAKGRISLDRLLTSTTPRPTFTAEADGNVDLYFVTGVSLNGQPAGSTLPSLQGTVHVAFGVNGTLAGADAEATGYGDISYGDLVMDAGSFVNEFMAPIVSEIYKLTRPFKTIADILMAPIPVLKEIAALTGQRIGTLLDLLEEAARKPLSLVRSVVGMVQLVGDLAAKAQSTLVGLGSYGNGVSSKGGFKVAKKDATKGSCGKKDAAGAKQPKDCSKTYKQDGTKYKQSVVQLGTCPANGCTGKELARTMTRGTSKQKFEGLNLSFPFLNDTSAVMGLLVGENATLVRFDTGAFGVSTSLEYSWGPFMAGPVPIDISIGGTIGLSARFAVGYDTRGIVNVLKQSRDAYDPSALADGIFIDDLDEAGNDVPEIKLTFVVTLGASVSISIFKVGLYGGVGITIGFDLVDPDNDGKLYMDEIEQFLDNPICLFRVEGLLDFFFGFFVEVDLKLWSKRWNYELFRLKPPIKLFEVECQRFEPDLAVAEGANLRLNVGESFAAARHYKSTRTAEKFVVRQMAPVDPTKATPVQVEFSGLVQDDLVPAGGRILADSGTGNDVIELASGTTPDGTEVPFTIGSTVNAGAGEDRVTTAAGADTVDGGADADKVSTAGGDDTVSGSGGDDVLDGGLGTDVLDGGAGSDKVSGNAGSDWVAGGADDDTLTGGPGLNAAQAATARTRNPSLSEAGAAALLDGRDVVVGNGGADTLAGHFGDDWLFGGAFSGASGATDRARLGSMASGFAFATACATTSADGGDQLNGEAGDDVLVGDAGDDRLSGGPGGDSLCAGDGNDTAEGDTANSTATGDDTILGGNGADSLVGRGGADVLDGGAGDDLLDAGDGSDDVTGGTGADAIDAGNGDDVVVGDTGTIPSTATITTSGSDVKSLVTSSAASDATRGTQPIVCRPSANVLAGGLLDLDGDGAADSGRFDGRRVTAGVVQTDDATPVAFDGTLGDRVVSDGRVQGGVSSVAGVATALRAGNGASSDCVIAGTGSDAVFAGPGDDTVLGEADRDYLQGDAGNDLLRGYQADDEIDGGADSDAVYGDTGADVVTGGAGTDDVHGGIGNDVAYGGPGDDTVSGEDGNDVLVGGSSTAATADGNDTVDGGADADVIAGDNATPNAQRTDVTLHDLSGGFAGNDVLGGQTQADTVYGQGGDDTIDGHEDSDILYGNGGTDTIHGSAGNDVVVGGTAQAGAPDAGDVLFGDAGTDTMFGDNVTGPSATFHDGNAGSDTMHGGDQDDLIFGQGGGDTLNGNAGNDRIVGGSGVAGHGDGGDTVHGNDGTDTIAGDNAAISGAFVVTLHDVHDLAGTAPSASSSGGDTIDGDAGADTISGQGGGDTIRGGDADDVVEGGSGNDTIDGDAGNDRLVGGNGIANTADGGDTIHGDDGTDTIAGDNATISPARVVTPLDLKTGGASVGAEAGGDTITGDAANDVVYATGGDDDVHGNGGDDYVEGGSGSDTIAGDDGVDRIIGGSSTADVRDSGDTITGNAANDTIAGDNATIAPNGDVVLLDVRTSGQAVAHEAGGDTISGNDGDDVIRGQSGDDAIGGGSGADYVEGNAGDDTIAGNDGDDRLTGGSGTDRGGANGAVRELRDTLDGGDTISGGGGTDVATGDNARVDAGGTVTLYDEDVTGTTPPPADVSGPDTMRGDAGTDRLYGQGDGDTMSGGTENDVMEGDSGADTMTGDAGDDDLVGGTTRDGAIRDGGDTMNGNAGTDVMLGDNGVVTGSGATARWTFFDLDAAGAATHPNADLAGNDVMHGDADADWVFGQSGDDTMTGDGGDDRMQGDGGADTIAGDDGADDVTGGSATHFVGTTPTALPNRVDGNDTVTGGTGADVVVGDNGRIDRTGTDLNTGDASRSVTLFDVAVAGGSTPQVSASGVDTVNGNEGRDLVFGGGAGDTLHGDAGDDHVEGNAGADTITGDADDDDIVGGGSSLANGLARFTAPATTGAATATNLADGGDTIDGGTGEDAVLADNGVVARTLTSLGAWTYHAAPFAQIPRRTVQAPVAKEVAGAFGDDTVNGGDGHDELHGELGNDTVNGGAGDDAVEGDLARVTVGVNGTGAGQNGKAQQVLTDSAKFLDETVFATGSLQRDTLLYEIATGGNDTLDGGAGNDSVHAGAGNDTVTGNAGATDADPGLTTVCATAIASTCDRDVLFGGDGDDWLWGGPDKDHVYGGYGSDHLDVVRPGTANPKARFVGPDVLYGGWDQDAMQGDLSSPSPNALDKLIDGTGVYNIYYVCEGAYGGNSVVRSPSPSMLTTLQALSSADGASAVTTKGSSGYVETSIVFTNEFTKNSSPAFLDSPGNFTCT